MITCDRPFWRSYAKLSFVIWLSVAQVVSWGTTFYAFALFIGPLDTTFGWSKAQVTGAFTLTLLLMGLAGISVGAALDRIGGRWLMTGGSILNALLLLALSQTHSLAFFYLFWISLGLSMATTLYPAGFAVTVATLGAEARDGVTLMTLIAGFASTVFIPFIAFLIEHWNWQVALEVIACCNLLLCAPIHWLTLRHERIAGSTSARPRIFTIDLSEGAVAQAVRNPRLWWLAYCFAANSMLMSGITVHIIPLLGEYGFDLATIVTVTAMIGPMQVAGRLLITLANRWLSFRRIGIFALAAPLLALIILGAAKPGLALVFLFPILYGAANGIITIVRAMAVPELIGPEAYGSLNGILGLVGAVALACAPVVVSWTWKISQSYTAPLILLFVVGASALFAFLLATRGSWRREESA